jgi:hypothetical protein
MLSAAKPLSRSRAWTCLLMNQAATPGLGSVMGRRFISGSFQLLLALAGFGLLCSWIVRYFYNTILQQLDKPISTSSYKWLGEWGLIFFSASWLWAWFTSVSLLRQAQNEERNLPPRITNPPPGI